MALQATLPFLCWRPRRTGALGVAAILSCRSVAILPKNLAKSLWNTIGWAQTVLPVVGLEFYGHGIR